MKASNLIGSVVLLALVAVGLALITPIMIILDEVTEHPGPFRVTYVVTTTGIAVEVRYTGSVPLKDARITFSGEENYTVTLGDMKKGDVRTFTVPPGLYDKIIVEFEILGIYPVTVIKNV